MKVLHIIEIRGIGGAEKMLIDFLQVQKSQNHQITCLLIYKNDYKDVTQQISEKLSAFSIDVSCISYSGYKNALSLLFQINYHIKQVKPDVIHTHLRLAEFSMAVLKTFTLKVPVVTTVHGYGDEFQNQFITGISTNINLTLRYYITLFILKKLDAYVFISNFLMEFYIKNGLIRERKKASRIDNAIIITQSTSKSSNSNNIKIILPGRFIEWKGHVYAFKAMELLAKKYPFIKLDCYGTGPYQENLAKLIKDMGIEPFVELKGFIQNIAEKIKEYDVVVIPSLFESFGIVFLDAFDANVPVVAFDIPAGNEIITNGVNGLLAHPKDPVSLADKIETLIEDTDLRHNIILKAHNTLIEKYSMDLMAHNYFNVYSNLLK